MLGKSAADFKSLACWYGKHCLCEERIEPVEYRFAKSCGNIFHEKRNCSADAIAIGLRLQDGFFHFFAGGLVRAADGGGFNLIERERVQVGYGAIDSANGRYPREKFCACDCLEECFRDGACGYATDGLAGRTSAPAAVIAETVLEVVAEVCMPRSVPLGNVGIVFAVLVFVKNDERNGRARRFAFENAGKNFHLVLFVTGGRDLALARTPAVQFGLNHLFGNRETCGASIEDGSNGGTMGFTPCSD